MSTQETTPATATVITPEALLEHWQGHRRLTRRLIEAFPEDQLFTFSIGGMRTFGKLSMELLHMAAPMAREVIGDQDTEWGGRVGAAGSREEILRLWDETTEALNAIWPKIGPERFQERMLAFGQYEGVVSDLLLYVIDNEIHHRGQGYVYLRALGIEPPPFYER